MIKHEIGDLYFMIWYADEGKKYIMPEAVVFVGQNLEGPEDEDRWYFQDPESFCAVGAFPRATIGASSPTEGSIYKLRRSELDQIVDSDGLRKELLACASRHAKPRT